MFKKIIKCKFVFYCLLIINVLNVDKQIEKIIVDAF